MEDLLAFATMILGAKLHDLTIDGFERELPSRRRLTFIITLAATRVGVCVTVLAIALGFGISFWVC